MTEGNGPKPDGLRLQPINAPPSFTLDGNMAAVMLGLVQPYIEAEVRARMTAELWMEEHGRLERRLEELEEELARVTGRHRDG